VLNKERSTGSYRLSAYFMGKVIAETPLEIILPIAFACITYWMVQTSLSLSFCCVLCSHTHTHTRTQVGLAPRAECFILYIVFVCLFALLGSGIGLLIGATMLDVKKALTVSVIVVLSSVLLGGFFISQENLRVWIRWSRWVSFMKVSSPSPSPTSSLSACASLTPLSSSVRSTRTS
jgi:ABC-type multidrug transport system permease subunit